MNRTEAIEWFKTKIQVNDKIGFSGDQNDSAALAIEALEYIERAQARESEAIFVEAKMFNT